MMASSEEKRKHCTCSLCPFPLIKDFRKHNQRHGDEEVVFPVKKEKPDENIPKKDVLPTPSFECPNCPQKFHKSGSYRRHLLSHLDLPPYCCKDCPKVFMEKQQLFLHREKFHRGPKVHTCTKCTKTFDKFKALVAHETAHNNPTPYECSMCSARFPTHERYLRHALYHATPCALCLKPFNNEEQMWKHFNSKHPNSDDWVFLSKEEEEDEFWWYFPDSNFSELKIDSDSDLYTSDDSIQSDSSSSMKVKTKISNVCFICERRFCKKIYLDKHMKSHRIFFCNRCPKFFPRSSLLKMHLEEHIQSIFSAPSCSNISQLSSELQPFHKPHTISSLKNSPENFMSWYNEFKNKIESSKFPLLKDDEQYFKEMINELASNIKYIPDVEQKNYEKILKNLIGIIEKNTHYEAPPKKIKKSKR